MEASPLGEDICIVHFHSWLLPGAPGFSLIREMQWGMSQGRENARLVGSEGSGLESQERCIEISQGLLQTSLSKQTRYLLVTSGTSGLWGSGSVLRNPSWGKMAPPAPGR